jgi:hypothetical protein
MTKDEIAIMASPHPGGAVQSARHIAALRKRRSRITDDMFARIPALLATWRLCPACFRLPGAGDPNAGDERELTMMRWGMPSPPRAGEYPVTNSETRRRRTGGAG